MDKDSRIYVAGHRGFIGPAIIKVFKQNGYNNLLFRTSQELNLCDQAAVTSFFQTEKPEYVILNAAKRSGIMAKNPAEQLYENMMIASNVIQAAYQQNVKKLLYTGSATLYPIHASSPIKENAILTGELDPFHAPHAIAKIAGVSLCKYYHQQYGCDFFSGIPSNVYGVNEIIEGPNIHVVPGMMMRFHKAKMENHESVVIWGTGKPTRDFIYVDDVANAFLYLLNNYNGGDHINIGTGVATDINTIAATLSNVIGYKGSIEHDLSKPDGAAQRVLDNSLLASMGWRPTVDLQDGLQRMYTWYVNTDANGTV